MDAVRDAFREDAVVEGLSTSFGEDLHGRGEVVHRQPVAGLQPLAVGPVDRFARVGVTQDDVENRVQVRLLRRDHDSLAGDRDRRLEERRPRGSPVRAVRLLEPGDDAGRGDRGDADTEGLGARVVEVDGDRVHLADRVCLQAGPRYRDEEVEEARTPVLRAVDEQEAAAAGARQCALRDPGDEGGPETGVDRVAAVGEDARSGLRRQRVPGCDGASHGAAISS